MNKIPTLYVRDPKTFRVTEEVHPDCKWVFEEWHDVLVTEKLDGTNIRVVVRNGEAVHVQKRRNPSRQQKKDGIINSWYVSAYKDQPEDRHIFRAVGDTDFSNLPDEEYRCEAIGPSIQGNPLGLKTPRCVILDPEHLPEYNKNIRGNVRLDKESIRNLESVYFPGHPAEGIVFWHRDGRMAKIKRSDFNG